MVSTEVFALMAFLSKGDPLWVGHISMTRFQVGFRAIWATSVRSARSMMAMARKGPRPSPSLIGRAALVLGLHRLSEQVRELVKQQAVAFATSNLCGVIG